MKKTLIFLFALILLLSGCARHPSEIAEDIAFVSLTPDELLAQASDLLADETLPDNDPVLAEIEHFSGRLKEMLADGSKSEDDIAIAALYLQESLHRRRVDLNSVNILEIQSLIREGEITYQELTYMYLTRIELFDKNTVALNSIIALNPNAMEDARKADEAFQSDPAVAQGMFGIPVLIKDNTNFAGLPTTAGAVALAENIPPYHATMVANLIDAGAIILGKTNLGELSGMMTDYDSSALGGRIKHPFRPNILIDDGEFPASPMGSSGGSAVAAAAAFAAVTTGTETSGSLLQPAAVSNVVTLKPTVGLISRHGIIPVSNSQDTPGPMARNVTDLAILLNAMTSGVDAMDAATSAIPEAIALGIDYTQSLRLDGLSGMRIGILELDTELSEQEQANLDLVKKVLEDAGVTLVTNADGSGLQYPTDPGFLEYIYYEFKKGINAYLATLDPDFPIRSLADIIQFNLENPQAIPNGQETLLQAEEIDIDSVAEMYDAMILEAREAAGPQGIDALLQEHDLDALLGLNISFMGAVSGYPTVSVPLFLNAENVSSSSNVVFTGTAFSEALLIEIAYVVEQGTHFRPTPGLADMTALEEAIKLAKEQGKDPEVYAFALEIYYSGLSTQFEVDKATTRLMQ